MALLRNPPPKLPATASSPNCLRVGWGLPQQGLRLSARQHQGAPQQRSADLDLDELRKRYGARQVRNSTDDVRTHYGVGTPHNSEEITRWLNSIRNAKPRKGTSIPGSSISCSGSTTSSRRIPKPASPRRKCSPTPRSGYPNTSQGTRAISSCSGPGRAVQREERKI
mgnify:CR=1 FL=1